MYQSNVIVSIFIDDNDDDDSDDSDDSDEAVLQCITIFF